MLDVAAKHGCRSRISGPRLPFRPPFVRKLVRVSVGLPPSNAWSKLSREFRHSFGFAQFEWRPLIALIFR